MNKKLNKERWLNFLPQILYKQKTKKNNILIKHTHISQYILNWNSIWFYVFYQLKIIKNNLLCTTKVLVVSEFLKLKTHLKIIAKLTHCLFLVGPWKNGYLSNIYWYKYLPNFILNFGMLYVKKYLNEIRILNIPNIFFFNIQKNHGFLNKLTYFIITTKQNYIYLFTIYFLILYIFKKFINIWNTALFQTNKKVFSSIFYLKTLKKIKKKELIFINPLNIYQKLYKNNFIFTNYWMAYIKKYKKIISLKKIIIQYFHNIKISKFKLFCVFIKIKEKKKKLRKKQQILTIKKIEFGMTKKIKDKQNHKIYFLIEKLKPKIIYNIQKWLNVEFLN